MQQGGYPTNILEPIPLQSQLPQCPFLYTQNQHPQCQPPQSSYSALKHTFGIVPKLTSDTSPMSQNNNNNNNNRPCIRDPGSRDPGITLLKKYTKTRQLSALNSFIGC